MPGHSHRANHKGKSRKVTWQHLPTDAISNPDPTFFNGNNSSTALSHGQSKTWKSDDAKERDQFSRVKILVHHLVPDSPFPPQSLIEWLDHRAAMQDEAKNALVKNIEHKNAQKSADSRIPFTSTFGPDGGHAFADNRSSVVSLPSIWSTQYSPTSNRPDAQWPERAEMQHEGEERAGRDGGKTNFGRFLPLPRIPGNGTVKWDRRPVMLPLSMIDITGIKPGTRDEEDRIIGLPDVLTQNQVMNADVKFWEQGEHCLGRALMDEL